MARIGASFTDGHPVGTIWVLDPKTQKVNLTCSVTFLGKSYGEWDEIENPAFLS